MPVLSRARVDDATRDPAHRRRRRRASRAGGCACSRTCTRSRRRTRSSCSRPTTTARSRDLSDDAAAEVLTVLARPRAGAPRRRAALRHRHRQPGTAPRARRSRTPTRRSSDSISSRPTSRAAIDRQLATPDDLLDDDIADARDRDLVVQRRRRSPVWCPFASTSPLLVRVCNTEADTTFDSATDGEVAATADRRARRPRRHRPRRSSTRRTTSSCTRHHVGTSRSRRGSACSRDSNRRPVSS